MVEDKFQKEVVLKEIIRKYKHSSLLFEGYAKKDNFSFNSLVLFFEENGIFPEYDSSHQMSIKVPNGIHSKYSWVYWVTLHTRSVELPYNQTIVHRNLGLHSSYLNYEIYDSEYDTHSIVFTELDAMKAWNILIDKSFTILEGRIKRLKRKKLAPNKQE